MNPSKQQLSLIHQKIAHKATQLWPYQRRLWHWLNFLQTTSSAAQAPWLRWNSHCIKRQQPWRVKFYHNLEGRRRAHLWMAAYRILGIFMGARLGKGSFLAIAFWSPPAHQCPTIWHLELQHGFLSVMMGSLCPWRTWSVIGSLP